MNRVRDGDLYKILNLFGKVFEIRYGYYEKQGIMRGEPIPIYPDFKENPEYTPEGYPFVTQMQDICEHGSSRFKEGLCIDCKYFKQCDDMIGICQCPKNRKK